jgi:leucyl aminopeptidase
MSKLYEYKSPFTTKKSSQTIPVILLRESNFAAWVKSQPSALKKTCLESGFAAQPERSQAIRNIEGEIQSILHGIRSPCGIYDTAAAAIAARATFSAERLKSQTFAIDGPDLTAHDIYNACLGWGLACYRFDAYKKSSGGTPILIWPKNAPREKIQSDLRAIYFLRNLVNAPSNDMGPDELESAARHAAKNHGAKISVIQDKELLKQNFPLIYTVGRGSHRRPRLIDISWGNPKHPKLTLVGKGVCFDTGGLNIKPTASMALMKKDMGGAAHVLALGMLIMAAGLHVNLRILIPAVENSIGGDAFRPGDIIHSRKGLSVENTNTDAEGRLILADTLTYACEDKPDLLIDFATLTGSARAALGPDIPPFFTTDPEIVSLLQKISLAAEDPVWNMPLWKPYRKNIESPNADLLNSSGIPGDLIYSAVFLEQFLLNNQDWLHLDIYAWEHSGRPGRPKGGAETGLRSVFKLVEDRYGQKQKNKTKPENKKSGGKKSAGKKADS